MSREYADKAARTKFLRDKERVDTAVDEVMGAFCRGLLFVGVTPAQIQQAALKAGEIAGE